MSDWNEMAEGRISVVFAERMEEIRRVRVLIFIGGVVVLVR